MSRRMLSALAALTLLFPAMPAALSEPVEEIIEHVDLDAEEWLEEEAADPEEEPSDESREAGDDAGEAGGAETDGSKMEQTDARETDGAETEQADAGETGGDGLDGAGPEQTAEDGDAAEDESEAGPGAEEASSGEAFTPAYTSPYVGQDATLNYWTLPMDITAEDEIWQVLMAPITVVDVGKGEKAQVIIRSQPDKESDGVGVVTCETQGVHVLERGGDWSLIECYSSSFHDSKILNWNTLVQGYVPTDYLKEMKPNQEMGLVIDKLTQRLYLFREGRLFSTLLVSTGIANPRQPYNETRSGEFLMTSKVGTFASDNLKCAMAIRFNSGDLLHEVPYLVNADGTQNYGYNEPKLGTKASHGCIRVQRKKTPEGINMSWIWKQLKNNSRVKLLIWEDWQGRQIPVPEADSLVYYNPNKGQFYHSQATCSSTKSGITFESFHYGDLDTEPYSKLKRCESCAPPLRVAEIEAINAVYAPGGDHDPVLTEARQSCPKPLGKK